MASHPIRVLSLCSGYGGLDLAVKRVFPAARTICYVEREVSCVRVLASRMADGALDPAPVWDDVSTFDPSPWAGAVDLVVAGFPCQPHSVAGKREGVKDDRWPVWDDVIRIARGCAAQSVFLENVPGLLTSSGGEASPKSRQIWLTLDFYDVLISWSVPGTSALISAGRGGFVWGRPTATDCLGSSDNGPRMGTNADKVRIWCKKHIGHSRLTCLPHPAFLEWLMGLPKGWTRETE